MKTKLFLTLPGLWLGVQLAAAQGTFFTYQGRLDSAAGPATGNYSFQFQLFNDALAGSSVGSPFNTSTRVSNGLFTVTLDFGIAPFNGQPLWLQLWAAPSNSPPPVPSLLSPRQRVTPTPYAITASNALTVAANAVSGASIQNNAVSAGKIASGQVVKSLNGFTDAVSLTAGANVTLTPSGNGLQISATGGAGGGWGLTGNAGTTPGANYLGASDSAQVRLHATGGFLVDNTTPNLSFGNQTRQMLNLWAAGYGIGVQSSTLYQRSDQHFAWFRNGAHSDATFNPGAGGALLMYLDSGGNLFPNSSVVLDRTNVNNGELYPGLAFGSGSGEGIASKRTAGGNQYGLDFYTGFANRMMIRNDGAIGVGTLEPEYTFDVEGSAATRGSLLVNSKDRQDAAYPELPGIIFGNYFSSGEVISSQRGATGPNPFGLDFYTGFGRRLSIANNGNVGIGTANPVSPLHVNGTITATSLQGSGPPLIILTTNNQPIELRVNGERALRLEPSNTNFFTTSYGAPSVIGGSVTNTSHGSTGATISGGGATNFNLGTGNIPHPNQVATLFGTIGGGADNTVVSGFHSGTVSIGSGFSTIGGGVANSIYGFYSTIAGGYHNTNESDRSTIGGGFRNLIGTNSFDVSLNGSANTISGGENNSITASGSYYSTIGGGRRNTIAVAGFGSTVGGGDFNLSISYGTTIGGGLSNSVTGAYATIPGGLSNTATNYGFAAGRRAKANHPGAFVWADSLDVDFRSIEHDEFAVRATKGARFATQIDGSGNPVKGVMLVSGGESWGAISDRNAKKNFQPVDGKAVLEKLAHVPVQQWNYKCETDGTTPHFGPMAQDFKAAFFPGRDDKIITTLEFDGVELAAIQGLSQIVKEKESRISVLEENVSTLEKRLTDLEKLVQKLADPDSKP